MPAWSHQSSDQWRRWPSQRLHPQQQPFGRWRARQTSRRFADVGVRIPAARLREITAGAPVTWNESIDVNFAFAATGIRREQRRDRAKHTRHRVTHCLIVAGLVLAALNLLICMGYAFISLALHETPF